MITKLLNMEKTLFNYLFYLLISSLSIITSLMGFVFLISKYAGRHEEYQWSACVGAIIAGPVFFSLYYIFIKYVCKSTDFINYEYDIEIVDNIIQEDGEQNT